MTELSEMSRGRKNAGIIWGVVGKQRQMFRLSCQAANVKPYRSVDICG